MRKADKKLRDIKFFSKKNNKVVIVHTVPEMEYAKKLEEDEKVLFYEYGIVLDEERLSLIKTVDIRGAYFNEKWQSDYMLTFKDSSRAIREIETEGSLEKLPNIEKLELSRRYWKICGIHDFKIIISGGDICS